jgi:arylsulfatase A-like enzyme
MFVRWPGHVAQNAVDGRLAANVDLAPTVLKAIGVPAPAPLDGEDLFDPSQSRTRWLTEGWHETDPRPDTDAPDWAAITTRPPPPGDTSTPHYHYIEYYDDLGAITFREYYDLRADPLELHNLYGSDGGPANDPPTTPSAAALSTVLAGDRGCSGAGCP